MGQGSTQLLPCCWSLRVTALPLSLGLVSLCLQDIGDPGRQARGSPLSGFGGGPTLEGEFPIRILNSRQWGLEDGRDLFLIPGLRPGRRPAGEVQSTKVR